MQREKSSYFLAIFTNNFYTINIRLYKKIDCKISNSAIYSRYELFKIREVYLCASLIYAQMFFLATYSVGARISMNLKATINCTIR